MLLSDQSTYNGYRHFMHFSGENWCTWLSLADKRPDKAQKSSVGVDKDARRKINAEMKKLD